LLQQEAGKALDPRLVSTFLEHLPALLGEADAATTTRRRWRCVPLATPRAEHRAPSTAPGLGVRRHRASPTARSTRSINRPDDGTSLGVSGHDDAVSSRLMNLVPFSACALFLYAEATDTLFCLVCDRY